MEKKTKKPAKGTGKQKTTNLDEFHKLNTKEAKGHLHYVCGKTGNKYESVGVTHAQKTKGTKNVPLHKNPDPNDKRKAYIRPALTEEKRKQYGKQLNGLGLSTEDKKKVWELIEQLRKEKKTKK